MARELPQPQRQGCRERPIPPDGISKGSLRSLLRKGSAAPVRWLLRLVGFPHHDAALSVYTSEVYRLAAL